MAKRERFFDRFRETAPQARAVPNRSLKAHSRRDFLLFGAGVAAAAAGFWWLMPDDARQTWLPDGAHHALDTLDARLGLADDRREKFLDRPLTFDDDVAEARYPPTRTVRSQRPPGRPRPPKSTTGGTPARDHHHGRAAAARYRQVFVVVGVGLMRPISLAYTAGAYWVFRGKVGESAGYH